MKVLIVGGSGMLGHRLWLDLGRCFETWATLRTDSILSGHPDFDRARALQPVDVRNSTDLVRAFTLARPQCVINCVGIVKQAPAARDPLQNIELNALFPHRLAELCAMTGARLIHISTDCVFTGARGNYSEEDLSDATDLYGRTKYLGEVSYRHTLTLRTSFIGRELGGRNGLVEWFLSQGGPVYGFRRAIYSGLTADELARVIRERVLLHPEFHGIYHVASAPISKYELLLLLREAMGHQAEVVPDDAFVCDRTLNGSRFEAATGYVAPAWRTMIARMADYSSFYVKAEQRAQPTS